MAIRFACASCGKHHRVGDHLAGLPGRCGRCGYRFVAPGVPKLATSPIFVSTAAPDPFDDDPNPRRRGIVQAIGIGLILAALALLAIFQGRDRIVAVAPGLAAMLPAKAAPPAPAKPRSLKAAPARGGPSAISQTDIEQMVMVIARICVLCGLIFLFYVLPIIGPPILSRRGYLSVGRWLIFAGLAFFLASLATGMVWTQSLDFWYFWYSMRAVTSIVFAPTCLCAVVGCLTAAAIHPKIPPTAGGI